MKAGFHPVAEKYLQEGGMESTVLWFVFGAMDCQNIYPQALNIVFNPLFGENIVLQQKQKIPVWGTAKSGGKVTVVLDEQKQKEMADSAGNRHVDLAPVVAGGPYELIIRGKKTIRMKNVLVGEVCLYSGQSKMEMPVVGGWAKVYGMDIPYSGPMYKSMKIQGDTIHLVFTHTDGGLKTKGDNAPEGFAIAEADRKFVRAKARMMGDEIVVWSPEIKKPVAVRYAWAANPVCNLYNGAGLPASPFRTDDWKGITYGKK